jgi:type I restriction enzyme, R subunit
VKLIEKAKRQPFYTDFKDEIGDSSTVVLHGLGAGAATFEQFRRKATHFLEEHNDNPSLRKLRSNQRVTKADLDELERILLEVGDEKDLERATEEGPGLGLFIRSLVGLDREAAKQAFGAFLSDGSLTANQVEFINQLIDHLTEQGAVQPKQLYDSPYTDIHPHGPQGVFTPAQIGVLLGVLNDVRVHRGVTSPPSTHSVATWRRATEPHWRPSQLLCNRPRVIASSLNSE